MLTELRTIFRRDLTATGVEVTRYPDDETLWRETPGCPNSGGTLVLHMVGNLRHYVGAEMGGSDYVRDRPAEFGDRGVPRDEIQALIRAAIEEVDAGLAALGPDQLDAPSNAPVGDGALSNRMWLMHLSVHLAYHLGQLNYHRRILTGDATDVGTLSLRALVDG